MQVSLDGFIEGPNGDMSWMQTDGDELWKDLFKMLQNVDLHIMGRVMFPGYRDYWKAALTDSQFSSGERAYAKYADKTKHIVFSKTLKDPEWGNTTINTGGVAEEVRKLKQLPGKDIYVVGGALMASTVINAGLVDEYRLTVNPVVVAEGKSFFQQVNNRHDLVLKDTKAFSSGVVVLIFDNKKGA